MFPDDHDDDDDDDGGFAIAACCSGGCKVVVVGGGMWEVVCGWGWSVVAAKHGKHFPKSGLGGVYSPFLASRLRPTKIPNSATHLHLLQLSQGIVHPCG